jgi:CheY-like chemotaxis protein
MIRRLRTPGGAARAANPRREVLVGKSILVIDDEQMILDTIKIIFEDMGHTVTAFADPAEGIKEAERAAHDLILVDIRMPKMNGAEVTRAIRSVRPEARILIITAYPSDPLVANALDSGAFAILKKPFEIAKILDFLGG